MWRWGHIVAVEIDRNPDKKWGVKVAKHGRSMCLRAGHDRIFLMSLGGTAAGAAAADAGGRRCSARNETRASSQGALEASPLQRLGQCHDGASCGTGLVDRAHGGAGHRCGE